MFLTFTFRLCVSNLIKETGENFMKKCLFLAVIALCFLAIGCNSTGVPVEFAKTCDKANDDKTVEITGYFNNTGSAMCSSGYGNPMRCPIDFVSEPNKQDGIVRAEIDLGSGANYIAKDDVKGLIIHDDKNQVVENSNKVKITADVNTLDTPREDKKYQNCWVVVKKIEKAQ